MRRAYRAKHVVEVAVSRVVRRVALAMSLLLALAAVGSATGGARYYVDGARSDVADGPALPEDEYLAQCVPYSRERPDSLICGDVPDGFVPGDEPGGFDEYREECLEAIRQAALTGALAADEELLASSCHVQPTSTYEGKSAASPEYLVSLVRISDHGKDRMTILLDTDAEVAS